MNDILYRYVAKLIDVVIFLLVIIGISFCLSFVEIPNELVNFISIIITLISYIFLFIVTPFKFEKSIGKKMLGLKIEGLRNVRVITLREPFLYVFILVLIGNIIGLLGFDKRIISIFLYISLIVAGLELALLYFKCEYWNKIPQCKVVGDEK